MAISASTVWEVRPGVGSDSNGGGFVSGATGTDYSQQDSAEFSGTDLVLATTTTVSSASHSFVADDVGNLIRISAGTGFTAGFYQILSVTSGVATLDRAAGTASSTGGTWAVGGALETIPTFVSNCAGGNVCWVKATATISLSSAMSISAPNGGSAGNSNAVLGYLTTRGDEGQVTIKAAASLTGSSLVNVSAIGLTFANFIVDGNSEARGVEISGNSSRAYNVTAKNFSDTWALLLSGNFTTAINCQALNNSSTHAFESTGNPAGFFFCVATGNSGNDAFSLSSGAICTFCIAANNAGTTTNGFSIAISQSICTLINCVAYGNSGDGFKISSSQWTQYTLMNCISYGNSGYGFDYTGTPTVELFGLNFNAYGDNTSGNLNSIPAGANDVTLSVDPFTDGANDDFSLNSTSGGGVSCRAAGFPGTFSTGGTGYQDIGTLQHQDSGGSTTYVINQNRIVLIGTEEI